ncbi:ATP-dependent Clp protease adapter ClpS [Pseudobacteriovorax antillogorgiicola]|uniref:ATP-dependent Clp protease adapter protein ClpS n=1 Tax=Pseudobacteriovorax antillogorgiicola TaxID=1513793 RepID=A0A1Y6BWE4_9BACT|nr:ATP-dependent Clp protease adapter ClpS [Pseudobacteriovorax antillogorgiicola]TCS50221.1 ATP-dependent Clp protease adaptor protein ClpS [Pseudobacteriovorax antillogorgiicola]SMF32575.1 ATP-dependent Clp protease adaptor protein ClpS [Pseudobacteriovorax antillogorgiicola]
MTDKQIVPRSHDETENDTGVVVKEVVRAKKPPLYSVILLNDDYTPMEFVVSILERHFNKDHAAATDIMLKVHNEGRAICGIYTYEIAETKVTLVTEEARQSGHPLQCVLERA